MRCTRATTFSTSDDSESEEGAGESGWATKNIPGLYHPPQQREVLNLISLTRESQHRTGLENIFNGCTHCKTEESVGWPLLRVVPTIPACCPC